MKQQPAFTTLRHDFSHLSKNRLRTYNLMVEEWERQQEQQNEARELDDDALEMLAAAGTPDASRLHNE